MATIEHTHTQLAYLQGVHRVVEVGHFELAWLSLALHQTRLDGILQDGVEAVQEDLTLQRIVCARRCGPRREDGTGDR